MTIDTLKRLVTDYDQESPVSYRLNHESNSYHLSTMLGEFIKLRFTGRIFCCACGRKTSKSFNQGYCFPCMRSLPEADMCMLRPETCHFAEGTCRDENWASSHCNTKHTVYLANGSGLKVGITRQDPIKRWIDQGATQGLAAWTVNSRLDSGLVEASLKRHVADKTRWRKMLQSQAEPLDLLAERKKLEYLLPHKVNVQTGSKKIWEIRYPIAKYPDKIKSFNFDKNPDVAGHLQGIKAQYLILDTGVINIKKFRGYEVEIIV